MGKPIPSILFGAAIAAVLAVAGCGPPNAPPAYPEPVEMRSYTVPEPYKDNLRVMLQSTMRFNDQSVGRVTNGPGGGVGVCGKVGFLAVLLYCLCLLGSGPSGLADPSFQFLVYDLDRPQQRVFAAVRPNARSVSGRGSVA